MPDRRFPISSADVPACIGREAPLQRMLGALTKPAPDHLQVIGARFAGKTVLLTELIRRLWAAGQPYTAIIHWDLGHRTPADDGEFLERLRQELVKALRVHHPDYAKHLEGAEGSAFEEMSAVLEILNGDGKVLAVLDGFDKALANGRLTRNLWDQMRELAAKPSLRLVTASRRTLRELIRHPDAQTSDFWNIFEPSPIRVGCFDDQDLEAVLERMPEVQLSGGARTELLGATNGYPVLTLEVLNTIAAADPGSTVSPDAMRNSIDSAYPALRDRLDALWADCPSTAQDLFRLASERSTVPRAEATAADLEWLVDRGLVHAPGGKLQRPNRMLARLLGEMPNDTTALARLFGAPDAYEANLRDVFERRVAQLAGLDGTLRRYLEKGLEDLPHHPSVLLTHIRGFLDHVFELIWQVELPSRQIPSAWLDTWKFNDERGIDSWLSKFPQGGSRVRLLELMTGTDKSDKTARYVSRGTKELMDAAWGIGNFGQHQEGARIDVGTAYAALHVCIELAASLQRDFVALP
jgi:hypothetical protein